MARSTVEAMGLQYEAERLVRRGMSRAEVSRMLGVHQQTLAQWALQGGWRKKDIDLERSGPTTKRTIRNIATAHEQRRIERETLEAQAQAVQAAVRLIAEMGPGAAERLERLIGQVREMPDRLAPLLPAPDPKAREASLGDVVVGKTKTYVRRRRKKG